MIAKGTVHKFGDNVDTDVIIPARYLNRRRGGGSGCRQRGALQWSKWKEVRRLYCSCPTIPLPGGPPSLLGDTGQIKASPAHD